MKAKETIFREDAPVDSSQAPTDGNHRETVNCNDADSIKIAA